MVEMVARLVFKMSKKKVISESQDKQIYCSILDFLFSLFWKEETTVLSWEKQ